MDGTDESLDREALIALVVELRRELLELREQNALFKAENSALRRRVEELERGGGKPTKKLDQAYSLRAEEQRQQRAAGAGEPVPGAGSTKERQRSLRRGRVATNLKVEQADLVEVFIPDGFHKRHCERWRTRVVWRIREGRAVRVAYELWRGPGGEEPVVEGVGEWSEFAREIHLGVAYLSLIVGLSLDKVCELVRFFWQLELSKSQAKTVGVLVEASVNWTVSGTSPTAGMAVNAATGGVAGPFAIVK